MEQLVPLTAVGGAAPLELLIVAGPDRERLLHGLVSGEVRKLEVGAVAQSRARTRFEADRWRDPMNSRSQVRGRAQTVFAALFLLVSIESKGELLFLTDGDELFVVDSKAPGSVLSQVVLENSSNCPTTLAVDPRHGDLYAVRTEPCSIMQPEETYVFRVDAQTGATISFYPPLPDEQYWADKDISPLGAEMRIVDPLGENQRLVLDSGEILTDTPLQPFRGIQALASVPSGSGFATFGIASDAQGVELVRIGGPSGDPPASSGEVVTIGSVVIFGDVAGFDIGPSGAAYLTVIGPAATCGARDESEGEGPWRTVLCALNLETGATALLGTTPVGTKGQVMTGMAAVRIPFGSPMEIPTLGQVQLLVLATSCALAGIALMRTRTQRER